MSFLHSSSHRCRSLTLLFVFAVAANAAPLTFTNFRPFNANLLDSAGDVVISSGVGLTSQFVERLATGVTYSPIRYPSSGSVPTPITYVTGINDSGVLAGYYGDGLGGVHGFTFDHGAYTPINALTYTYATAINNRGDIAGYAGTVAPDAVQAFLLINGTVITSGFPALAFPNSSFATGLNDSDTVVGYYVPESTSPVTQAFVRSPSGTLTTFAFDPNSLYTIASGINDSGVIVGSYLPPGTDSSQAFAQFNGTNYSYQVPGAISTTFDGITNSGIIYGSFTSAGQVHEFLLDVTLTPEPATSGTVAIAVLALVTFRLRRCKLI